MRAERKLRSGGIRCGARLHARRQTGLGLIGWLLMIPASIVVLLILAVGFYEGRKAYWDSKVRGMCEKDGGVIIFERVSISKKELDGMLRVSGSVISLKMKDLATIEDAVYLESREINIREANPRVRRTEWSAVRQVDKKIVAQWNSYGRIGGDIPTGLAHDSSFRCPDWQQTWTELRDLFVVKEN